jgi:hypothetical protein
MNYSLKEKGLIASLIITLIVFGDYFIDVFRSLNSTEPNQNGLMNIITVVILIAVLEAIIHSILAGVNDEVEDERDKLIERLSYRNAYWVLCVGAWFLIAQVFLDATFMPIVGLTTTPFGLANLILFAFILAEVIMFITQLYYYRKGVV